VSSCHGKSKGKGQKLKGKIIVASPPFISTRRTAAINFAF
jgi:hypothetical protein